MKSTDFFYKQKSFIYYFLLFFLISIVDATENPKDIQECTAKNSNLSINNSNLPTNKNNLFCQVNAFYAYQELKNTQTLLVDIRSQQQYQKISIPGSINIPLHTLKTKQILKKQRLFLIDDGGRLNNIPLLCRQLKQQGFNVSYIAGGINAWSKLNKNLLGQPEEIVKMDELGPEHFKSKVNQRGLNRWGQSN